MTAPESMINRARLLATLASDPRTPQGEREAAQAKLTLLINKWSIDELDLDADDTSDDITMKLWETSCPAAYAELYATLAHHVAKAMDVLGFITRAGSQWHTQLIGHASDIDRVELLINSIVGQCALFLEENIQEWKTRGLWSALKATERYNFRRTFIIAFTNTIVQRIVKSRAEVISEARAGTDIVLFHRRDEVQQWIDQKFNLRSQRRRNVAGHGGHAGRAAGQRANIGQQSVGHQQMEIGQ